MVQAMAKVRAMVLVMVMVRAQAQAMVLALVLVQVKFNHLVNYDSVSQIQWIDENLSQNQIAVLLNLNVDQEEYIWYNWM